MTLIVLFHVLVALVSLGIITLRRWWILLGAPLFILNGWAFLFFLEHLKR